MEQATKMFATTQAVSNASTSYFSYKEDIYNNNQSELKWSQIGLNPTKINVGRPSYQIQIFWILSYQFWLETTKHGNSGQYSDCPNTELDTHMGSY